MGLKQQVVIVSRYSIKQPDGSGSRGATPGHYVERYMARPSATETVAPIRLDSGDDYMRRYSARERAVEHTRTRLAAKQAMRRAQRRGGVAFGYGSVSLSHEQLRAASRDIQQLFDAGRTVIMPVISFQEEYLRAWGIIDPDFQPAGRGSYRGNLDQMKLRLAVMHGLDRMVAGPSGFDDLRYVGVIQVDTEHVHCHLAMVDAGGGQITSDGTQRGKLKAGHIARLRRGIDAWLAEKQPVRRMDSAVGYERRNVATFIKRQAHEQIRAESLTQFLLACLPADRELWRAGSPDARMRKPDRLIRHLVAEQLDRPGSPGPVALTQILAEAHAGRSLEELASDLWGRTAGASHGQVLERAIDAVYRMLAALPPDLLRVRTALLDVMSMDYQTLAARERHRASKDAIGGDDLASFGFRLRTYSSRLRHHRERSAVFRDLARQWERADASGAPTADSHPLYRFYRFEADYQQQLMAKYQYFLPFPAREEDWYEQREAVAGYGRRLSALIQLRADASLQRIRNADLAERLGRELYDQPGGGLLTRGAVGRTLLDGRIADMRVGYADRIDRLRERLAQAGRILKVTDPDPAGLGTDLRISRGVLFDFDAVKGLDLHHLRFDFLTDARLGAQARETFLTAVAERYRLLTGAIGYLDDSGQQAAIADLPTGDVAAMIRLAAQLDREQDAVLPSRLAELTADQAGQQPERSMAPPLHAGLVARVRDEVDHALRAVVHEDPASETSMGPHLSGNTPSQS